MKSKLKIPGATFIFFVIVLLAAVLVCLKFIPKAPDLLVNGTQTSENNSNKEVISLVAVGDSLTEGVGDTTNSGGFVPLASKSLKEKFRLNAVQTTNYGVAGNRSDQILKRIQDQTAIQKSLTNADVITLTVGGNDLMKVVRANLFESITVDTFTKPMKTYQQQLAKIFTEIRLYNQTAPIYVFGIYNPFYLYFPEIEEMQEIVDSWNTASQTAVEAEGNAYFIPINDLLYKGLDGTSGLTTADSSSVNNSQTTEETSDSTSQTSETVLNNLIYEEDHFHPNNLGYQIMANALVEKLEKTQMSWYVLPETR